MRALSFIVEVWVCRHQKKEHKSVEKWRNGGVDVLETKVVWDAFVPD